MIRRQIDDGMLITGERETFREALREHMKKINIIPSELARRASISRDSVSSYMNLRSLPSEETLARIAKALRCKPNDLMTGNNEEPPMVCETRGYHQPGHLMLVVRMPVPYKEANELMGQLLVIKEKIEKAKSETKKK